MLAAHRVHADAGGRVLLRDVCVQIVPGRLTCLVGPNGAGKSSLLRVLAGDLPAGAGTVEMNGTSLSAWPLRLRARSRAVLSQSVEVAFGMRALDVVLLGRIPHQAYAGDSSEQVLALRELARVGMSGMAQRRYSTLSGGEKQRVQLARCLVQIGRRARNEAAYLLLDEPTAALDLRQQHATLRLLRRRARTGIGVLVIVHDLALAAAFADHVAVLDRGRIVVAGAPHEALRPDVIGEVFGVRVRMLRSRTSPRMLPVAVPGAPRRTEAARTHSAALQVEPTVSLPATRQPSGTAVAAPEPAEPARLVSEVAPRLEPDVSR
ncbi:MAG TPA: heme ABC transporter ATP-binding protein [Candidatus Binatia bacterium]|nr:heme ABC transporter ATP-binding protein [Candidatus Binatia bacterium]